MSLVKANSWFNLLLVSVAFGLLFFYSYMSQVWTYFPVFLVNWCSDFCKVSKYCTGVVYEKLNIYLQNNIFQKCFERIIFICYCHLTQSCYNCWNKRLLLHMFCYSLFVPICFCFRHWKYFYKFDMLCKAVSCCIFLMLF